MTQNYIVVYGKNGLVLHVAAYATTEEAAKSYSAVYYGYEIMAAEWVEIAE